MKAKLQLIALQYRRAKRLFQIVSAEVLRLMRYMVDGIEAYVSQLNIINELLGVVEQALRIARSEEDIDEILEIAFEANKLVEKLSEEVMT